MAKPDRDPVTVRRGHGAAALKITVLGKSPAWQDAGGACSGYLVESESTTVLLDCGGGVFAKLRQHVDYTEVDAVVISHVHADHFIDLVPYSYGLLLPRASSPFRSPATRGAPLTPRGRG